MSRHFTAPLSALALLALVSCEPDSRPVIVDPPPPPQNVASHIRFFPGKVLVHPGGTARVLAIVLDTAGLQMQVPAPDFAIRDGDIATVLGGTVTGTRIGRTWLVATSGTLRDSMLVDVRVTGPAAITVVQSRVRLVAGGTFQIQTDVRDSTNYPLPDEPVAFVSRNPAVAAVAATSGVVTAATVGTAWIVASAGDARDSIEITVQPGSYSLTINPSVVDLVVGDSAPVSVTALDATGVPAPAAVLFRSGDPAIFSVSTTGTVTSLAAGAAWLHVSVGPATDSIRVRGTAGFPLAMQPSVSTQGGPFGIAVSQGRLYTTLIGGGALGRFLLPGVTPEGQTPVGGLPTDVVFTRDGTRAYVANAGTRSVSFVNTATGQVPEWHYVPEWPWRLRLSADESVLYVTTGSGKVLMMDPATGAIRGSLTISTEGVNGIELSPDGTRLFVSAYNGVLAEISTATNTITRTMTAVGVFLQDGAVAPNGGTLYIADQGGPIRVVDLASWTLKHDLDVRGLFGLRATPDGKFLVGTAVENLIVAIDRFTGAVQRFEAGGSPRRIAIDASYTAMYVADVSGHILIFR